MAVGGTLAAFRRSHRRAARHPRHARRGAVGRHVPLRRVLGRGAVRRGDADRARRADLQGQRRRAVHRRPRRLLRVRDQRLRHDLRGLLRLGAGVRVERLRAPAGVRSHARGRQAVQRRRLQERTRAARASATGTGTCRAWRRRSTSTARSTTTSDRDRGWTVEMRIPWRSLEPLAMPDGRALPPRDGDVWRMDFSRFNQYKEAPPAKDPGGWAWSPHGVWDSHMPELFTRVRFSTAGAVDPPARPQDKAPGAVSAASPMRTEAEARARADANRRERQEQRLKTGAPVELISDYVKANIGPVPASLGVSPFYKKYADALGIPVIASDKVPDAALLVARDIVNTMLAARPDIRKALIARKLAHRRHRRSRDDDGHPGVREDEAARRAAGRTGDAGGSRLPRQPLARPRRQPDDRRGREPARLSRHALLGRAHLRARVRARDHGRRHPRRRPGDVRRDPRRVRRRDGGGQVRPCRRPQALRDDERRRVLGGGRPVVVLLELRRVLRRQRQGRDARGVRRLRSDAQRADRPRVHHATTSRWTCSTASASVPWRAVRRPDDCIRSCKTVRCVLRSPSPSG